MRLPLLDLQHDGKIAAIFAHIKKTRGVLSYVLHSLGHAPDGLKAFAAYGEYVRYQSGLAGRERELTIITLARGNQYAWSHHVPAALKAGVTQAEVDEIHEGRMPPTLSVREQAGVLFAGEFANLGKVSDATFSKTREAYGERGVTDIALLCGYFLALASFANTFDLELEPYYKPLWRG